MGTFRKYFTQPDTPDCKVSSISPNSGDERDRGEGEGEAKGGRPHLQDGHGADADRVEGPDSIENKFCLNLA